MAKNVLVVGGSYFAGRLFVQTLADDPGFALYVLNRGNAPLDLPNVTELACDRNNPALLRQVLPSLAFDAVVDFCAYHAGDVNGLFQALPPAGVKHYILISTVSIYAPTADLPVGEDAPKLAGPQPELGPASDYGYNKWLAEYASMAHCRRRGIPYTHIRPCIIYGKYNYAPRESYFFDLIHADKPVLLPENDLPLYSFVSVRDVARALQLCLGNEKVYNQSFNLAAPDLVNYTRLVEVLGQVMGREVAIERVSPREIDARRIPLPFPMDCHLVYSGVKAARELGFQYTRLADGLGETWDWYRQTQLEH